MCSYTDSVGLFIRDANYKCEPEHWVEVNDTSYRLGLSHNGPAILGPIQETDDTTQSLCRRSAWLLFRGRVTSRRQSIDFRLHRGAGLANELRVVIARIGVTIASPFAR